MQQIAPRISSASQDHVSIEPVLRDQLDQTPTPPYSSTEAMQHSTGSSSTDPTRSDSPGHNPDLQGGESSTDGRKGFGKRELSTSKRAAQNRAAQRAFRQRKEGYIKKLEEQVRDYQVLNDNFKTIQAENYQLRDYIIKLQSRLLESQGEVPPPPSNLDGLQPGTQPGASNRIFSVSPTSQPQQQRPSSSATSLPRLSELGAIGSQPPPPPPQQQSQHQSHHGGPPPPPAQSLQHHPSPLQQHSHIDTRTPPRQQPQQHHHQDLTRPHPQQDSSYYEQPSKRVKTEMTPAQQALQGPSIMQSPTLGSGSSTR